MTDESDNKIAQLRPRTKDSEESQVIEGDKEIGDVVRLQSSDVEMTVTRISGSGSKRTIFCTWFSIEGELGEAGFDSKCLKIVRKAE